MKTKSKPAKRPAVKKSGSSRSKGNGRDPRKPGTDPDQTPTREVQNVPVANPGSKQ